MENTMDYTLTVTSDEARLIMDALVEMPFKKVNMILNKLYSQLEQANRDRMEQKEQPDK